MECLLAAWQFPTALLWRSCAGPEGKRWVTLGNCLQAAHPIRSRQRNWIDFFFLKIWWDDQQTRLGGLSPPMPLANTGHNCKFNLELMLFNGKNISQEKHILGDFSLSLFFVFVFVIMHKSWETYLPSFEKWLKYSSTLLLWLPCLWGSLHSVLIDSSVRHMVAHTVFWPVWGY